jgi:SAM-dependent methyltransferase
MTVAEALLSCPRCGGELSATGGDAATLVCPRAHRYPVVRGVPRLFEAAQLSEQERRTSEAFGFSWTHYPKQNPYTEEQSRDWFLPLEPSDFEGKLILDAGCGLGGFCEYALSWGARQVVGVDLSEAIDAAHERLGDSVTLVQADLLRMPFPAGSFDLGYSIGVLHHLEEPERGFRALAEMVRPGGYVFAWVYGRENNWWIVHLVDPLRKHVFSRLPKWATKWIVALPAAAALFPLAKLSARVRMPYGDYLRWLGERDFEFVHGVVFDHLVAPTAHYLRREEFEAWFDRAGLELVSITWRNRNSWRGLGRVPA